jgi:hypothetical protein
LVAKIRKLPPDSQVAREDAGDLADWSRMADNVARLVDLFDYWLRAEYAKWTADEDEIKAARRNRRKPPPFPLIPPVASRPPSLHQHLSEMYEARASEFRVDDEPRMVSDDEFDALLGL